MCIRNNNLKIEKFLENSAKISKEEYKFLNSAKTLDKATAFVQQLGMSKYRASDLRDGTRYSYRRRYRGGATLTLSCPFKLFLNRLFFVITLHIINLVLICMFFWYLFHMSISLVLKTLLILHILSFSMCMCIIFSLGLLFIWRFLNYFHLLKYDTHQSMC